MQQVNNPKEPSPLLHELSKARGRFIMAVEAAEPNGQAPCGGLIMTFDDGSCLGIHADVFEVKFFGDK